MTSGALIHLYRTVVVILKNTIIDYFKEEYKHFVCITSSFVFASGICKYASVEISSKKIFRTNGDGNLIIRGIGNMTQALKAWQGLVLPKRRQP